MNKRLAKELRLLAKTLLAGNTFWYHGSNVGDIKEFVPSDNETNFLGKGVYFYKDIRAAKNHGRFVYKVKISPGVRILDKEFMLSDGVIEGLMNHLKIGDLYNKYKLPIGVYSPSWWFTESYNYFKIPMNSMEVKAQVKRFFDVMSSASGVVVNYPNGGDVLFLWDKFSGIIIKDVKEFENA